MPSLRCDSSSARQTLARFVDLRLHLRPNWVAELPPADSRPRGSTLAAHYVPRRHSDTIWSARRPAAVVGSAPPPTAARPPLNLASEPENITQISQWHEMRPFAGLSCIMVHVSASCQLAAPAECAFLLPFLPSFLPGFLPTLRVARASSGPPFTLARASQRPTCLRGRPQGAPPMYHCNRAGREPRGAADALWRSAGESN